MALVIPGALLPQLLLDGVLLCCCEMPSSSVVTSMALVIPGALLHHLLLHGVLLYCCEMPFSLVVTSMALVIPGALLLHLLLRGTCCYRLGFPWAGEDTDRDHSGSSVLDVSCCRQGERLNSIAQPDVQQHFHFFRLSALPSGVSASPEPFLRLAIYELLEPHVSVPPLIGSCPPASSSETSRLQYVHVP